MKTKILVTYATRAGSTAEIANEIGKEIGNQGAFVHVCPVSEVKDLEQYNAVIVGSGIRAGKWMGDAKKFLNLNVQQLSSVPIAYFSVCLAIKEDNEIKTESIAVGGSDRLKSVVISLNEK